MNVLAELGLAERVKARGTLALENRLVFPEAITPLGSQVRHFALWLGLNLFGERSQDWVYRYRVDWGPVASP